MHEFQNDLSWSIFTFSGIQNAYPHLLVDFFQGYLRLNYIRPISEYIYIYILGRCRTILGGVRLKRSVCVSGWDASGVSSSVWFLGVLGLGVWFGCPRGGAGLWLGL